MTDEIKDLLGKEIKSQIESISDMETGTEERTKAIDDLTKLYKLRIDENNADQELALKIEQTPDPDKERKFKIILLCIETGVPLLFYGVWLIMGMNFEKTGSLTSNVFRGFTSRIKPTKKG